MRSDYVVKTIASAAHLLGSCENKRLEVAILTRTLQMLNNVWEVEFKHSNRRMEVIDAFWSEVHTRLESERKVSRFQAIFGEEVNPPGTQGRVHITFSANKSVSQYRLLLEAFPRPPYL